MFKKSEGNIPTSMRVVVQKYFWIKQFRPYDFSHISSKFVDL